MLWGGTPQIQVLNKTNHLQTENLFSQSSKTRKNLTKLIVVFLERGSVDLN